MTAAMEPAVEWREHEVYGLKDNAVGKLPQWSPPWNGGNTSPPRGTLV